jgi:hypothetical protein
VGAIHNTMIDASAGACHGDGVAAARKPAQRDKPGRPIDAPGPIGDLARVLGSWQALADHFGCTIMTVQRWAAGVYRPNLATRRELNRLAKRHRTPLPFPADV